MDYKKLPVEDFASPIQLAATPDMSVSHIADLFKMRGFRHMPVVENGTPVGIVSSRDVALLACFSGKAHLTARDVMVNEPYTVVMGTPLHEVALEMSEKKIGSALVLDEEGQLDSIFTSIDSLNALVEVLRGDI